MFTIARLKPTAFILVFEIISSPKIETLISVYKTRRRHNSKYLNLAYVTWKTVSKKRMKIEEREKRKWVGVRDISGVRDGIIFRLWRLPDCSRSSFWKRVKPWDTKKVNVYEVNFVMSREVERGLHCL